MKNSRTPWQRLADAARLAPEDGRAAAAPYGFATRVSALAFSAMEPSLGAAMARFSWRALGVASVLMVLSVAANLTPVLKAFEHDITAVSDPVGEWLSFS